MYISKLNFLKKLGYKFEKSIVFNGELKYKFYTLQKDGSFKCQNPSNGLTLEVYKLEIESNKVQSIIPMLHIINKK